MFMVYQYMEEEKLVRFAKDIEQQFFTLTPYHFQYPIGVESKDAWDENFICEIKKLNKQFLSNLIHNANLYMIYTRKSVNSEWKARYIGERKSNGMRARLTNHLINKNDDTGAKLDKVKSALVNGEQVGVNLVKVQPEELRLYVEAYIIKQNSHLLDWNNHS